MSENLDTPRVHRSWVRRAAWVVVPALLAYAVVAATTGIGDAFSRLGHADLWWLAAAVAAVAVNFVFLGGQLRLLTAEEAAPSTWLGSLVAPIAFALGSLLPAAPVEGMALCVIELRRRGMSSQGASIMLTASQGTRVVAVVLLFAIDRPYLAATGQLGQQHPWTIGVTSLVPLALALVVAWAITRQTVALWALRATRRLPVVGRNVPQDPVTAAARWREGTRSSLGSAVNQLVAVAVAVASSLCCAASMWWGLRAVGAPVPFDVALYAYLIAIFTTWVPVIPSGLGVAELVVPALLHHFGVPTASGLAAVLVWRAANLFLPALAGVATYLVLRATRPSGRPVATDPLTSGSGPGPTRSPARPRDETGDPARSPAARLGSPPAS